MLVTEAAINDAYLRSCNRIGWRLLTSPVETLSKAQVAFIGLNPGGNSDVPEHPRFAMPHGSAYVRESWGNALPGQSSLQRQVRALFHRLRVAPKEVLSGNLVPFRSPSWSDLPDRKAALEYGGNLWSEILKAAKPRLIVCMGGEVTRRLCKVLGVAESVRVPVGWGNVTGSRAAFDGGVLVGLPHLSRFPVVDCARSEPGLSILFGADWHK